MRKSIFIHTIISYLIFAFIFCGGFPSNVNAGFVNPGQFGTELTPDNASDAEIHKIESVLENKIVSERLKNLGLNPDEIKSKLSSLPNDQLHNVATQIDNLYAGGADGIGLIIGLLVIVLLVIVILQLTGHKLILTRN